MTRSEFNFEINRLKKVFGELKYPEERVNILFDKLGGLSHTGLRDQISYFIADCEKAPLLKDFLAAFHSQIGELKQQEIENKLEGIGNCRICDNVGCEIFYERVAGNSYAFQCSCRRGPLFYPAYPRQYFNILEKYASHREWVNGKFEKIGKKLKPNPVEGMKNLNFTFPDM